MATSTTNLVPVDFETIKANLKTYLKAQTIFKDADFEASNMTVLIDILAYNTFHNSFYWNMLASEMFLDTAQLQNSVASHAKMLNYLPRSYRSAKATVDITISPSNPSTVESVLIPRGTSFTGRANSQLFTFVTDKNTVVLNTNNAFVASGVEIYEGRYLNDIFLFSVGAQFIITDPTVDTTSIRVVIAEPGKNAVEYSAATSFVGVGSTSLVYFIQQTDNGQYQIMFGDGVFGYQPKVGSTIIIEYRISSGELPNTAALFDIDGPLGGTSNVTIQVVSAATGGAVAESLDQIRTRAPLTYATQQRAVTLSDFKTLIQNQFPDVIDVGVVGGEDLDPPRFGFVALSMVGSGYSALSVARATDVLNYIQGKCAMTITPTIIEPEFTFVEIASAVSYDLTQTTKTSNDIQLAALAAIKNYTTTYADGFNKTLRTSKMMAAIDASDPSVASNDTSVKLYRLFAPSATSNFNATFSFGNTIQAGVVVSDNHSSSLLSSIHSTYFTYKDLRCMIEDDGVGSLRVVTLVGSTHSVVETSVGTVDYTTGNISISMSPITAFEQGGLRIYGVTQGKDIQAVKNTALVVKDYDISVTTNAIRG